MSSIPDVVYATDLLGNIEWINAAVESVLQLGPDQVRGRNYLEFVRADARRTVSRSYAVQVARGKPLSDIEVPLVRADGETVWVRVRARLVVDQECAVGFRVIARDVTAEREALRALKERETQLRDALAFHQNVLNCVSHAVWTSDLSGRITALNQAAEQLLGYPMSELRGEPTSKIHDSETFNSLVQDLACCFGFHRRGASEIYPQHPRRQYRSELHLRRRDGSRVLVDFSLSVLENAAGMPAGYVAAATDITEKREQEDASIALGEFRRALLESASYAIISTDSAGTITSVNPATERMLGYSACELVGVCTPALFHDPAEVAQFANDLEAVIGKAAEPGIGVLIAAARQGYADEREWTFIRKDGGRVPVVLAVSELHDSAGGVSGYLGIARDISRLRQAMDALRESEERFRTIAEAAPIGIYLTDVNGRNTYANPEGLRLIGTSIDVLQSGKWEHAIHPEDRQRVLEEWQCSVARKMPFHSRHRMLHEDGTSIWVEARTTPILHGASVTGRIGTLLDVTAQQHAEATLRRAHDELEAIVDERTRELASALEELRALASHLQSVREDERTRIARELHDELGQQLAALNMEISSLRSSLGEESAADPTVRELLDGSAELVRMTIAGVRRLCAELRPAILDSMGLIPALEWLVEDFERRSKIPARVMRSPMLRAEADADTSTAVFRIVQESLTNVLKHASASEVSVKISASGNMLDLRVDDNGRGIDPERNTDGSFGLMGMRERAILLGGQLTIVSRPGEGTSVQLRVPAAVSSKEPKRG